jgi:hypothetical protein
MTSDDIRTEIRNLVLDHDAEGPAVRSPKLTVPADGGILGLPTGRAGEAHAFAQVS